MGSLAHNRTPALRIKRSLLVQHGYQHRKQPIRYLAQCPAVTVP